MNGKREEQEIAEGRKEQSGKTREREKTRHTEIFRLATKLP
jgi:hypothetical protein